MTHKNFIKVWWGLLLALALLAYSASQTERKNLIVPQVVQAAVSPVVLRADSGNEIEFRTQNGLTLYGVVPGVSRIPHLMLYHNDTLTELAQRTLIIAIDNIQLPPPGATVSLWVETQAEDPDASPNQGKRILVWSESSWTTVGAVTFRHTFTETVKSNGQWINTPTGYFRYKLVVKGRETTLYTFEQDYAFLMENRWASLLPKVPEASPEAAPDELVIYYCDMVPFQKDIHDTNTWLRRNMVQDYVGHELLPKMVEGYRIQSQDWNFPWFDAWTSYQDENDSERLNVILTDGKTWFHGSAPPKGNASISINVYGGEHYHYNTLTDGLMSIFHHELFHNLQKNINQHYGGSSIIGNTNGPWGFITEGTAIVASSVAEAGSQFASNANEREYFSNANLYLGSNTVSGDLGKNFNEISPYHAALYWRFLYEQCGGMALGEENSALGMEIIKRALISLNQIVEAKTDAQLDFDDQFTMIMDKALENSACPFQTYTQSLEAFAQAVDRLRFEGGRCDQPGFPEGCAFFDPNHLYNNPPPNTLRLLGVSP